MATLERILALLREDVVAGLAARQGPAWLLRPDGTLAFANAGALAALGAARLTDVANRAVARESGLAEAAARLARTLPHGGQARLERLRLFPRRHLVPATATCRRVRLADGSDLVAILLLDSGGDRPSAPADIARLIAGATCEAVVVADDTGVLLAASDAATFEPDRPLDERFDLRPLALGPLRLLVGAPRPADTAIAIPIPPLAEATSTDPPAATPSADPPRKPTERARQRLPIRFVWQTDADSRVREVSEELAQAVGARAARVEGEDLPAIASRFGGDAERLSRALAKRDTWSGLTLQWPTDDGMTATIDLAGLPVFDRERSFRGFRGYGVCRAIVAPGGNAAAAVPSDVLAANVVPLRPAEAKRQGLSAGERIAFREIGRALGGAPEPAAAPSAAVAPLRAEGRAAPVRAESPAPDKRAANDAEKSAAPAPDFVPSAFAGAAPSAGGEGAQFASARPPGRDNTRSEIEQALQAAEASTRELQAILDTATDGVVLTDRDGTILGSNRAAEALFGYEQREMVGRPFAMLFSAESQRAALDYLDGLVRGGVASVLNDGREAIGRVREGGLIQLFMTMGRVAEDGAKYCAVFHDITPWKRTEEELVAARRAAERASAHKSEFLAKISHELRTPLNAIIGFSEVMMDERFGPIGNPRYREYLRDIHTSGTHVVSLVNDLLDLSKIEAGKLDLAFTSVDLNDVLTECMSIMQPQANRERVIIRTSLMPGLPQVVADARAMRQIALNLLSNSVKFTQPGGQVILSTTLGERGEVTIRVRDTGIGMSESDIAAALEPFRQVATAGRSLADGTGLGLPLTKALVEANRASFAITSAPNAGTMVEVTFPPTRVLAE